MKFLFMLLLGYYAYRFLVKPMIPTFGPNEEARKVTFEDKKPQKKAHDDDYIDYEEIE